MDPVQHFEIPYKVRERAKKFYFQAFGWQLFDTPGTGYTFATTVEMEKNGMPKRPGAINGGLTPRSKDLPAPTLFMKVGDLPTHLERIRHAGGDILNEPVAMGPVLFARFRDTEGNILTCFQDNPSARAERDAVVANATRGGGKAKGKGKARATGKSAKAAKASKPGRRASAGTAKGAKAPARKARKSPRKAREPKAVWSR